MFWLGREEHSVEVLHMLTVKGYRLMGYITTSGTVASSWGKNGWALEPVRGRPGIMVHKIWDSYLLDIHLNHGNSGGPVPPPIAEQ
jgi:hypothetical protein